MKTGFSHKIIENTVNNFNNVDEELLIPKWLFDERKALVINLPSSNKNEHFLKRFCLKIEFYANGKVKFNVIWVTIRNAVTRKDEREQHNCKSEPFKHLKNNAEHQFDWMILSKALSRTV